MSKAEMVRRIADETNLTQAQAVEVVETIVDEIKSALQQGDAVTLRGFESFHLRDKQARIGRNPKTGQETVIPSRRVVRFKSGKQFKAAVNTSMSEPLESQT